MTTIPLPNMIQFPVFCIDNHIKDLNEYEIKSLLYILRYTDAMLKREGVFDITVMSEDLRIPHEKLISTLYGLELAWHFIRMDFDRSFSMPNEVKIKPTVWEEDEK